MRSLFFVLFSYFSKAALRTDWKLEEVGVEVKVEVEGVRRAWDIGPIHRKRVRDGKSFVTGGHRV